MAQSETFHSTPEPEEAPSTPITEDDFTTVWGAEDGQEYFEQYTAAVAASKSETVFIWRSQVEKKLREKAVSDTVEALVPETERLLASTRKFEVMAIGHPIRPGMIVYIITAGNQTIRILDQDLTSRVFYELKDKFANRVRFHKQVVGSAPRTYARGAAWFAIPEGQFDPDVPVNKVRLSYIAIKSTQLGLNKLLKPLSDQDIQTLSEI
jgi:hypothetical protein